MTAGAAPRAWLAWDWSAALRGLTYAIPAAVVLPVDVRTGAVVAVGTAIGFAFHFDRVGWAAAAALMVMRPAPSTLRLRAIGRPVSVFVGALVAIGLVELAVPAGVLAAVVAAAVVAATATATSRWYVTPAFTTFLVFLLLLGADPADAAGRFGERLGETLLGVAVAVVVGLSATRISDRSGLRERS